MTNTYAIQPNLTNSTITTGNIQWSGVNTSFTNGTSNPLMTVAAGTETLVLNETATLDVKGRVRINGEYLDERLERIETLLQIPTRDVTMESKYPKLKELWEQYNRELSKYKTWESLKDNK